MFSFSTSPVGRFAARFVRVVAGAAAAAAVTAAISVVQELPSFVPGTEAILVSGVLAAAFVAVDKFLRARGVY